MTIASSPRQHTPAQAGSIRRDYPDNRHQLTTESLHQTAPELG